MKLPAISSRIQFIFSLIFTCSFVACSEPTDPVNIPESHLEEAFPNLKFNRPVDLQDPRDGTNRLFIVEQQGIIYVIENEQNTEEKKVFLDLRDLVNDRGNEEGLLGLAFHPNYADNGFFFVNFTTQGAETTEISRFSVSANDPDQGDINSRKVLLRFNQPYSNHNGGQVLFGPDGYLYISTGDGGSGGDPKDNGQNPKTLLGAILRIDVDNVSGNQSYSIPQDNPFAGNTDGIKEEIYAYGLRNPWRFSFDAQTGWLWTGDVGQNKYEEIDIIEKGGNYGWNIKEGFHDYQNKGNENGLKPPIWEYDRSKGDVSVTGGYVYRGSIAKDLVGLYIYGDYASGRIWKLDFSDLDNPVNSEVGKYDFSIAAFGVDKDNELYVCAFDGRIYKFKVKE
ncbi:PQQ-dependent sugar dehydrogenase [Flexithrix dorotheae]|uniref:PQQ-dependent sugar dehydrogenase n=1 Tax=Flexithrix dorotheae TaxID=70993 RepID=UPI0003655F35|nr:PQQ-dependent sugar dehydrogenase [Flexithrix dorotheae]